MAIISRRAFLRTTATGAGAAGGYAVGSKLAGVFADTLEGAVEAFYGTMHDTIAEVGGVAEKRLQASADEVRRYLGETERDNKALQKYWSEVGILDAQGNEDLQRILAKVEDYTKESDLPERLRRLKDRLVNRLVSIDKKLEEKQPGALQRFNEWFSKKLKGEEQGSRKALDAYRNRLQSLVQVYDTNRNNKVAQTDLLKETGGYFSEAQKEVVRQIDIHLTSGKIKEAEEKRFFTELKTLAKQDPTGRQMADYLLNTDNYFKTLEASARLHELTDKVDTTIQQVTSLQDLLDQGLTLKKKLRDQGEKDLKGLQKSAEQLYQLMEQKKVELEKEGYAVEYELFPKLKAVKDSLVDAIHSAENVLGVAGGVVGAGLLYWLSGFGKDRATRRELLGLRKKVERLEKTQN